MTPEDKEELKNQINQQIESLQVDINRMAEAADPIGYDVSVGRLSRYEALGEKGVREANRRNLEDKLSKLRSTLEKINNPDFGLCNKCGSAIPPARIMAVPESGRCVNCA